MPAKKEPSGSTKPVSSTEQKRLLRDLNAQIEALCQTRAQLFHESHDPDAAAALLRSARLPASKISGPLRAAQIEAVFRELDSATRSLVTTQRIAFLGPQFSYSHLAAIQRFGQSADLVPVSTIGGVFEAVNRGDTEFGIVPIENSTDGRIVDTLEMLGRLPVKVCGEVPMPIHHNLLGIGRLSDIEEVQSKPQALSQCRNWLSQNLPKARMVAAGSTTMAAEAASQSKSVAAVASRQAATNYGLTILAANIEDNPDNVTRFAVIGTSTPARTGRDKTSLMFELAHQPGALAEAMSIFKRNRLNLTWIESFPKKGSPNEYLFFVELEGYERDAAVQRAIKALEKKTVRTTILGTYERGRVET